MGVRLWLEGVSKKPTWVSEANDTGAAIHVDRATVKKIRAFVSKYFTCISPVEIVN